MFCKAPQGANADGVRAAGVRCGTKLLAPCGAPTTDCELGCGVAVFFVGAPQGANAHGVRRRACVLAPNPSRLAALLRQMVTFAAGAVFS